MNDLESQEATAQELVSFAQRQGIDLRTSCYEWAFLKEGRFISLWWKDGKVHYNMQGPIGILPERYKASASAFRGMWHETGTLADLGEAFEFLKAWLIDRKEVDELPSRSARSYGIG